MFQTIEHEYFLSIDSLHSAISSGPTAVPASASAWYALATGT
jgi:hypothetical protein